MASKSREKRREMTVVGVMRGVEEARVETGSEVVIA